MSQHQGLPVAGYKPQSQEKIDEANEIKQIEERLYRMLDRMHAEQIDTDLSLRYDPRLVAIARTHLETGFMFMVKSIFQPARIALPEDKQ
jgi:hypothetical protein